MPGLTKSAAAWKQTRGLKFGIDHKPALAPWGAVAGTLSNNRLWGRRSSARPADTYSHPRRLPPAAGEAGDVLPHPASPASFPLVHAPMMALAGGH